MLDVFSLHDQGDNSSEPPAFVHNVRCLGRTVYRCRHLFWASGKGNVQTTDCLSRPEGPKDSNYTKVYSHWGVSWRNDSE